MKREDRKVSINSVSFGKVIAISGKPKKIDRLNESLKPYKQADQVVVRDVTHIYKNSYGDGLMTQAASRGEKVSVYITGEDIPKLKQMKSMNGILSSLQAYYNLDTMSMREAIEKITQK